MTREERENALHCLKVMIDEEVCEECNLYGTTGTDHCEADCVRVAIKALEQEPKWIPVNERLPEENIDVLICDSRGEMCIGWKGEDFERFKHWGSYEWDGDYEWDSGSDDIVAWMPLPKPYEPQKSEDKE